MSRQRGFSLVELMVAVVLGLLVTDALVALFTGVRSASRQTNGVSALSDDGRFALNFMGASLRGAGYMACNSTDRQGSVLNAGASPLVADYAEPLNGYEAVGTAPGDSLTITAAPVTVDSSAGDWDTEQDVGGVVANQNLDAALLNAPAAPVAPLQLVKGSDVLVVHKSLERSSPAYVTVAGTGSFTVGTGSGFAGGQIGVISNCAQSTAFQIASFTSAGSSGVLSVAGDPYSPGNASVLLVTYPAGSQVAVADTIVYYIGKGSDGDGALFAYDTRGGVIGDASGINQELVPDIENMQVLYGVDTSGNQSVGQYVPADQVASVSNTNDFNGVMSVEIALLAASGPGAVPEPATAPTYGLLGTTVTAPQDTRLRKVFYLTVSLRDTSP